MRERRMTGSVMLASGLSLAAVALTVTAAIAAPNSSSDAVSTPVANAAVSPAITPVPRSPTPLPPDPPDIVSATTTDSSPDAAPEPIAAPPITQSGDAPEPSGAPGNPPPGAPTITVIPPYSVPIDPQPTITSSYFHASCGTRYLSFDAGVTATGGHPTVDGADGAYQIDGGPTVGFPMDGSGPDWSVNSSLLIDPGPHTIAITVFVFDANQQEATRSASFAVTCG